MVAFFQYDLRSDFGNSESIVDFKFGLEIKTVTLKPWSDSEMFVESLIELFAFFFTGLCGVHESACVLSCFRLGLGFGFAIGGEKRNVNAVSSSWELAGSGAEVVSTSKATSSPSLGNGSSVLS